MVWLKLLQLLPTLWNLFHTAVQVAQTTMPDRKGVEKMAAVTNAITSALPALGATVQEVRSLVPHVQATVQSVVDNYNNSVGKVPEHSDKDLTLAQVATSAHAEIKEVLDPKNQIPETATLTQIGDPVPTPVVTPVVPGSQKTDYSNSN